MIRIGLVGLGAMGRGHLETYARLMDEDDRVKLTALCDVDPKRFETQQGNLNIEGVGKSKIDFSRYRLFFDIDRMLAEEPLDMVDLVIPTYLHSPAAVKALDRGLHVFCEKPMALTPELCQAMIDARDRSGKLLMIGQCLRFWPAYEKLKEIIDNGSLGKPTAGYYARFGGTPQGSFEDWYLDESRSGGCLLDQHIHDVDMVNWLFGLPESVSTRGVNVNPGAGIDALSSIYRYPGMSVTTEDDWSLNGKDMRFSMRFRQNFERGAAVFENNALTIYPNGEKSYIPDMPADNGYYRELRYFLDRIIDGQPIETAPLESTRDTIRLAVAERESARRDGDWVAVR
ncbi:MAG: Gfo/Idh/MocA family oxidoreductase [Oscillospiraceae bacterium]|jgi:predicted dehydrogenase|nr:Gfo/Idh/MocA family oxidoreductase [Oscillospiraceae bacterium]